MKSLKAKLRDGDRPLGSWLQIGDEIVTEIMAQAGFDWLVIDLEHSAIDLSQCLRMTRIIDLHGINPLVRLTSNDPLQIKRVMDCGAHGVVVPMVKSRDDAQRAVGAVRYPPAGERSVGLFRAQRYGQSLEEYSAWLEQESVVIIQIEHIKAVEDLDSILEVDAIDALIIGPYDLSGSLGVLGELDHPLVMDALDRVLQTAKDRGVPAGTHVVSTDPQAAADALESGFDFIAFGVDFLFLGETARTGITDLQKIIAED
tara:strand:- start:444 stop:1217 length:774 start_codon:yes stop_codon:yes gene_type:complete